MKKLMILVLVSGITGGAYAAEALKTLAAQAPAAAAGPAAGAPARVTLTAGENGKRTYAALAGLFESGQAVPLSELVSPDYPDGYDLELLTADINARLDRGAGHIKITGHYDFVGPVVYFSAELALAGKGYQGTGYSDGTAVMALKPAAGAAVSAEIRQNGGRLILKAAGLPGGTGYALLTGV